jgi:hypothetical protein
LCGNHDPLRLAFCGMAQVEVFLASLTPAGLAARQTVDAHRGVAHDASMHFIGAKLAKRAFAITALRSQASRVRQVTAFA